MDDLALCVEEDGNHIDGYAVRAWQFFSRCAC